jgi:DNA-binding beta-propeller fold protein YncE
MKIDLSCPVENRGVTVKTNSATGEPYALFRLFNLSDKVISSIAFTAKAYDSFGKELGSLPVLMTELDGQPKSPFAVNKGVSLAELSDARHVVADIEEITFSDGEVYKVCEENMTDINYIQPDYDEITRLKSIAGDDAVCYAQDPGPYWLCVCSRPNKQEDNICIRCGRDKQTILSKYSSHDKISKAIEERRLALEREELERRAEFARQLEEKRQKNIKIMKRTLLIILCVAVASLLGVFGYRFTVTKIADKKVSDGKYIEAYELYRSIGSSHIGRASEQAKGNTFNNMIQSGILTADSDNLYYINNAFNIVKESKKTEEKTILGEAQGISLSISGNWLYYMDYQTGELCRIMTDGTVSESVIDDTQIVFYTTIGNDLYYLAPDDEQAQNAEQMTMALYLMDTETKKVEKISTAQIYSLEFYKDKIYYIDAEKGYKLYVMDRKGKKEKLLVSEATYGFTVYEDKIYYSDGTMPEGAQIPELTLKVIDLDGKPFGDVIKNKKVKRIAADSGKIYFTTYEDELLYELNPETNEVTESPIKDFSVFNIKDGYIYYMDAVGDFIKTTADGKTSENLGNINVLNNIPADVTEITE